MFNSLPLQPRGQWSRPMFTPPYVPPQLRRGHTSQFPLMGVSRSVYPPLNIHSVPRPFSNPSMSSTTILQSPRPRFGLQMATNELSTVGGDRNPHRSVSAPVTGGIPRPPTHTPAVRTPTAANSEGGPDVVRKLSVVLVARITDVSTGTCVTTVTSVDTNTTANPPQPTTIL